MIKYILIISLSSVIAILAQDISSKTTLKDSNLFIEISINNNTKLPMYIPLSDWVLSQDNNFVDNNFPTTYIYNLISNYQKSNRVMSSLSYDCLDYKRDFVPILLKIDNEMTSKILIQIDTLTLMKNWSEKLLESDFDFRLSVADYYVLTDLFDIMKLNLEDFTIEDSIISIPLKHEKFTSFSSSKYISKTKLKGDYKKLIRLPFIKFIQFSGKLQR